MAFLPAAALIVGAIGAGVSAYGTAEAGKAQANAANYNAQVARNDATIATQNADYVVAAGQEATANQSRKNAAVSGKVKATQAASGVDVNTGSSKDVQVSERETGQLDSETVLNNAELKAYGYRSQATGFEATAGLESQEAEQAPIGADLSAAGGLLGSASSLGLKWSQLGSGVASAGGVGVGK